MEQCGDDEVRVGGLDAGNEFGYFQQMIDVGFGSGTLPALTGVLFGGEVGGFQNIVNRLDTGCIFNVSLRCLIHVCSCPLSFWSYPACRRNSPPYLIAGNVMCSSFRFAIFLDLNSRGLISQRISDG